MHSRFNGWRKSSRSDGGQNCVEVADAVDRSAVRVRDSKDPSGPVLEFAGDGWGPFVAGLKASGGRIA